MPPGNSEITESFAFEGLLSAGSAATLTLLVAGLAAWLLWRERRLVGTAWSVVFWGLRAVAVAIVLWMLAGPTHLTTQRLTRPQSIAVLVDSSASMQTTDPEQALEDARWQAAISGEPSPLAPGDRAVVSLAAAAAAGEAAEAAIEQHLPRREIEKWLESAGLAAERGADLIDDAADGVGDRSTLLAERAERIASLLRGPVDEALGTLREELAGGGQGAPVTEASAAAAELLRGAHRRSESLAGDLARWQAGRPPSRGSGAPPATRRERAEALLAKIESSVLRPLEVGCRVRRLEFNQVVSPVDPSRWRVGSLPGGSTPVVYDNRAPSATLEESDALDGGPGQAAIATDLTAALEQVQALQAEGPLRMVLLLTDGRHNAPDTGSPQDVAARLADVPIHVVPIGVTKPPRDVLVHRVEAPSRVVLNDTAEIEVLVTAFQCGGERLGVTLRLEGSEIDRKTIEVSRDRVDQLVRFRVEAKELGLQQYEIEVEPVADEASLANNLSAASIEVVRDKLRVLLADRAPRYEYRYLANLFRRDEHVVFDEFLTLPKLKATGALKAAAALPATAEEWSAYDVVILGDLGPELLTTGRQQSLAEYVRRGGAVILIAGDSAMPHAYRTYPLLELAPVEEGRPIDPRDPFLVRVPDLASQASAIRIRDSFAESRRVWESAYQVVPLYGISRYHRAKPNSETLLYATPQRGFAARDREGDQRASLLCWSSIGAGRVAYLAAPQTYLLRFRRGDLDHHRFWGQTLRWITATKVGLGAQRVRIETDRNAYPQGRPVEVTVWLTDRRGEPLSGAEFRVEAQSLGDATAGVAMRPDGEAAGRYVGVVSNLPTGAFNITPVGGVIDDLIDASGPPVSKLVTVEPPGDIEMINTQADRPLLEQIAELTGGQVLPPTAVEEVFKLVSLDPDVTETTRRTPLWNRWSYLLIVLGCLFIEWVVRKQKGLA